MRAGGAACAFTSRSCRLKGRERAADGRTSVPQSARPACRVGGCNPGYRFVDSSVILVEPPSPAGAGVLHSCPDGYTYMTETQCQTTATYPNKTPNHPISPHGYGFDPWTHPTVTWKHAVNVANAPRGCNLYLGGAYYNPCFDDYGSMSSCGSNDRKDLACITPHGFAHATCEPYAGSCPNGSLKGQAQRTQDDDCHTCHDGYEVYSSSTTVYATVASDTMNVCPACRRGPVAFTWFSDHTPHVFSHFWQPSFGGGNTTLPC